MTKAELTAVLQAELKGLSSEFDVPDYTNAINAAERDTGWAAPYSGSFKETWILNRSKRWLFSYLQTETAADFKYKQIFLNQPFEHYSKLIKTMDEAFVVAQEESPHEFAGVSTFKMFGNIVNAGFSYEEQTGRDKSYSSDNKVMIHPNDDS